VGKRTQGKGYSYRNVSCLLCKVVHNCVAPLRLWQKQRLLGRGFRHTGNAMGQVYRWWWRICWEINVFSSSSNITCFTFYIHLSPIYWLSLIEFLDDGPSPVPHVTQYEMFLFLAIIIKMGHNTWQPETLFVQCERFLHIQVSLLFKQWQSSWQ
jgi:hypothetical protein